MLIVTAGRTSTCAMFCKRNVKSRHVTKIHDHGVSTGELKGGVRGERDSNKNTAIFINKSFIHKTTAVDNAIEVFVWK